MDRKVLPDSEDNSVENVRIAEKCIRKKRSPRYERTSDAKREQFLALTFDLEISMREVRIFIIIFRLLRNVKLTTVLLRP